MNFEIGWLELAVGIFAISIIQGIAYAITMHYTNKHIIVHLEKIEDKLKVRK